MKRLFYLAGSLVCPLPIPPTTIKRRMPWRATVGGFFLCATLHPMDLRALITAAVAAIMGDPPQAQEPFTFEANDPSSAPPPVLPLPDVHSVEVSIPFDLGD